MRAGGACGALEVDRRIRPAVGSDIVGAHESDWVAWTASDREA